MKSYTDLGQSRKLAEFLSSDSADLWYQHIGFSFKDGIEKPIYFPMVIRDDASDKDIPCWSLAALLGVIRKEVGYEVLCLDKKNITIKCELGDEPWSIEINKDNDVDACYETILKLHELNVL